MKDGFVADYLRPIAMNDPARPAGALPLAGGSCWFDRVEILSRTNAPYVVAASDVPKADLARLSAARPNFGRLDMTKPRIMGILNITPAFQMAACFCAPKPP